MNSLARSYAQHPAGRQRGHLAGRCGARTRATSPARSSSTRGSTLPRRATRRPRSAWPAPCTSRPSASSSRATRRRARPFLERAEEQYKRSIELLAQAREATLDTAVQQRLGGFCALRPGWAWPRCCSTLERPAEVITALAGLEEKQDLSPDASAGAVDPAHPRARGAGTSSKRPRACSSRSSRSRPTLRPRGRRGRAGARARPLGGRALRGRSAVRRGRGSLAQGRLLLLALGQGRARGHGPAERRRTSPRSRSGST